MSSGAVVDCSVAMTVVFRDEATAATRKFFRTFANKPLLVPGIWHYEVANVLALSYRHGRIDRSQLLKSLKDLDTLQFEADETPPRELLADIIDLCRHHSLTAYDAAYLAVAMRRQLPLATLDKKLAMAAIDMGVELIPL